MLVVSGFDIIGDIHGYAEKLKGLLSKLGYTEQQGAWRHPERTAVFVGDLIDRGPLQRESIQIPRAMVEAGTAQIVLGNHEFNALAYRTWDDARTEFCRSRSGTSGEKHRQQHEAFIEQIGLDTPASREVLDWVATIPLWLDLGGLRVVHACWNQRSIDHLTGLVGPGNTVTDQIIIDGTTKDTETYDAIETLLKGPEIGLEGRIYLDKGGHERRQARLRWWDADATTLRGAALIPNGTMGVYGKPFPTLPDAPLENPGAYRYTDQTPVIVGHYWETGTPKVLRHNAACVDYSAGKGGPLVAYRWSGESELTDENFVGY